MVRKVRKSMGMRGWTSCPHTPSCSWISEKYIAIPSQGAVTNVDPRLSLISLIYQCFKPRAPWSDMFSKSRLPPIHILPFLYTLHHRFMGVCLFLSVWLMWAKGIVQWSRNMPDMSDRLVLMSDRELRPCRTLCPAGFNTHKISHKEIKKDHWHLQVINWENVWQVLKMSSRALKACRTRCQAHQE